MPFVNTKKMLNKALKNNYAIPAFNVCNLENIKAIVKTAETLNKDTIISVSESAMNYAGADVIVAIVKTLTQNSKTNFALHLDHGKTFEACKQAIDAGFTSVMYDGSSLSFEENVKNTQMVVAYAHERNVTVEAELGKIIGVEDMVSSNTEYFTNPTEAKTFVKLTKVDSLAISIGTAHGINKGTKNPEIQFNVINAVHNVIPSIPLVAHGSSSVPQHLVSEINKNGGDIKKSQGIADQTISKMAKTAISKINIDTDLRLAFTNGVRKVLHSSPSVFDPRKYLTEAMNEISKQANYIYSLLN